MSHLHTTVTSINRNSKKYLKTMTMHKVILGSQLLTHGSPLTVQGFQWPPHCKIHPINLHTLQVCLTYTQHSLPFTGIQKNIWKQWPSRKLFLGPHLLTHGSPLTIQGFQWPPHHGKIHPINIHTLQVCLTYTQQSLPFTGIQKNIWKQWPCRMLFLGSHLLTHWSPLTV